MGCPISLVNTPFCSRRDSDNVKHPGVNDSAFPVKDVDVFIIMCISIKKQYLSFLAP